MVIKFFFDCTSVYLRALHCTSVFVATPVVSGGGVWVQAGGTVYAKLPGTSSPALAVDMQVQGGTYDSEPSDGLTIDD
jgi:hypothetical protein